MTIEELRVLITAKTDGLQKGLNHAKSQIGGLEKSVKSSSDKVSKAFSGIGKALKAAGIVVAVKEITTKIAGLTKEAMSVDAQLENLSRTMGASKSAFISWARNNAAAFGISESAAVKYGNTFSNLISGFVADTSKSTAYTKQLIEASAVIASRTGRTVEDVNERIRSGLLGSTEAIEDLGINVNVALLETTDAFKQLANGRSWAKLTYQEQQQVRLFAIMEQSAKKFGTELAGGGATSLMMFRAQLENLKLELGRAFAPLAETVIPALTQFVGWIADAVRWTNAFFAALRGQTQATSGVAQATQQAAQAQGDLAKQTEKAGKAAKGALAGFDELNILATGDTDAGSSTAAEMPFTPASGGDIAAPDMDTSKIEAAAKKVKAAMERIKTAFLGVMNHPITQWLKGKFVDAWNFSLSRIQSWFSFFVGQKGTIDNILNNVKELTDRLWKVTEPIANAGWETFKTTLSGIDRIMQSVAGAVLYLWDRILELYNAILSVLDALGILTYMQTRVTNFINLIQGVIASFSTYLSDEVEAFKKIFGGILTFLTGVFQGDWDKAFGGLKETFSGFTDHLKAKGEYAKNIFGNIKDFVFGFFGNILNAVTGFGAKLWGWIDSLPQKIGEGIGAAGAKIYQWGVDVLNWAKTKPKEIIDSIVGFFKTLPTRIKNVWNEIIDTLNNLPERFASFGKNIISAIWNGICGAGKWIKDKISQFFGGIADGFLEGIGKGSKESVVTVPKLARGAVLPPNSEFLAVLGDQKQGYNIETPVGLMRQTFEEVLAQFGGGGGDIKLTANLVLDDGTLIGRTEKTISRRGRLSGYAV